MRIRGEGFNVGVILVENSSRRRIVFTNPHDSNAIAAKFRSEVCIDCSIYEAGCNGMYGVNKGLVQERISTTKSEAVKHRECKIPGSVIEYSSPNMTVAQKSRDLTSKSI